MLNPDRSKHGKMQSVDILERQNARKNYVMIPGIEVNDFNTGALRLYEALEFFVYTRSFVLTRQEG